MANGAVCQGFNVLALTETWLGCDTGQFVKSELVPGGYEFRHVPLANQKLEVDTVIR